LIIKYSDLFRFFSIFIFPIFIIFVSAQLFDISKYATFLRELGYGGGIQVSIGDYGGHKLRIQPPLDPKNRGA